MKTDLEQLRYKKAKKKMAKIKSFYTHLIVYIVVNTLIIINNFIVLPAEGFDLWRLSIPLFWGIGLLVHAFKVFGVEILFSKEWEERKIKAFIEKEKYRK